MAKFRNERALPRIRNIELSDKNTKLRLILAAVLLVVGMVAIALGVNSCVSAQTGWQEVQVSSEKRNCSQDFVCNFYFGGAGMDATLEHRQVVECYSRGAEEAYEIFNTGMEDSSLGNLTQVNAHPNEAVTVEPGLYEALKLVAESGSRHVYLAPVYEEYNQIFQSDLEALAAEYDPTKNPDQKAYLQKVAAFANDPAHVGVELVGSNQVKLFVSAEYLAFAREYGITNYLDFGWMKNAFIIDFLARKLEDAGHTNGYIASFDGYTRNLDRRGQSYNFNLFDRLGNEVFMPATLQYTQPISIVFLRNYPMSGRDWVNYYSFSDGGIATALADPADGMYKSATDNLVAYSTDCSCARIALSVAPLFIAENLDETTLNALAADGVNSIWFKNQTLFYNQKDVKLVIQETEGPKYTTDLYE